MTQQLLQARRLSKLYGRIVALSDVELSVSGGEVIGLLGHNGAGKSTLVKVLSGDVTPSTGELVVNGRRREVSSPRAALREGIVTVYQDGALSPSLTPIENVQMLVQNIPAWMGASRRDVADGFAEFLGRVFPGHGIGLRQETGLLTASQTQLVDAARGMYAVSEGGGLLVLDEATAAIGAEAASQLFAWIDVARSRGDVGIVLISHRLGEITGQTDRVVVLRNGTVAYSGASRQIEKERLIELMGGRVGKELRGKAATSGREGRPETVVRTEGVRCGRSPKGASIAVRTGELVGLGGLVNHGQRELLDVIFRGHGGRHRGVAVHGMLAYVSGDRAARGVFRKWSVAENLSLTALASLSRFGFVSAKRVEAFVGQWMQRLDIRAASSSANIMSLSGGSQQKVLIARALGSGAETLLLDDPTRGVDAATKQVIAQLLADFVGSGGSCLWYSSEPEELLVCDRVYVLVGGEVSAELQGESITEDAVIGASFAA